MATAKKVALSSVGKKTRTKASASVSSPKKKTVVKKAVKKATLPVIEKGSASKKIKIQNNTTKRSKSTHVKTPKKTIDTKLAHVENMHANRPKKEVVTQKTSPFPMKLPSMQLALLSPYRFPMLTEKGAMALARTSGVFFVVLGAIFTLFFSNGFFSNASQMALLGSATDLISSTAEQTLDCVAGTNCSLPLEVIKPQAQIVIANTESLSGSVSIKVNVANADSVTLSAYSEQRKQEFTLGSASKVSSDKWEMYWNTKQYDDGMYTIKARVQNEHGVYEKTFGTQVRISNVVDVDEEVQTPVVEEESDTTADTATDTPTDENDEEEQVATTEVTLSSNTESSDKEITFTVKAVGAEKVQLFARKQGDSKRNAIGMAYKTNNGSWKYVWNISSVAEGTYSVSAVAFTNGLEFNSSSIQIQKKASGLSLTNTIPTIASTTSVIPEIVKPILKPEIEVSVDGGSPVSKIASVMIEADDIESVEVFVLPSNTLVQRYLGTARKADTGVWTYSWDTTKTPNGAYTIIAYVRNAYGRYTGESNVVTVANAVAPVYTEEQQKKVDTLTTIAKEVAQAPITVEAPTAVVETPAADTGTSTETVVPQTKAPLDISAIKPRVDTELQRLATVLRTQDQTAVAESRESIEAIKTELLAGAEDEDQRTALSSFIETELQSAVTKVEEEVKRTQKIIAERTAEEATKDSDNDGVTDFDEVALYNTDPFSADTDGDGYTDGVEILAGYDPLDAEAEVLVAYESPKETGVVRDDVFAVTGITQAEKNPGEPEELAPAIISGKALPNSFVTLYIFSTPVVVTVKTSADGSWTYRLDKELEDGEHQVFVGVTDNAGKIVAKSSPFTFVKEAQAFTPVNAQEAEVAVEVVDEGSFISTYMIYLVLSISVVAIGLVLILLGIYIDPKQRRKEEVELDGVAPSAS